ncbi:MAG: hypothetical protein NT080_00360 [Spirochaetes bacterium]|nr:hypothetical protein [Spirochaetota bacterium]
MGIELVSIGTKGAKIWRDQTYPWRVHGAIGEGARSFAIQPGIPCDDTTGDPMAFVVTVTEAGGGGDSTIVPGQVQGYPLLLTTDNAEYDGVNVQLRGETAMLVTGKEVYLRGKFKLSDKTQSDFLFGLCELKTDLMKVSAAHGVLATNVAGIFFVNVDGSTAIDFQVYVSGALVSTTGVGTMTTEDIDYAIWWDGTNIHIYVDDVEMATLTGTLPAGALTPSINLRAGTTTAITASVAELGFVSIE